MEKDKDNIRFNVVRNALYHTSRRRTFEFFGRLFNFLIIILGAGSMAKLGAEFEINLVYSGAAIALIGTLQLVFDFAGRGHEHRMLQREYTKLLADIERSTTDSHKACAAWAGRMIEIAADEPPVLRAIDAKAYNDAIDATGIYEETERVHVPWYHKLLSSVISFDGYEYKKLAN